MSLSVTASSSAVSGGVATLTSTNSVDTASLSGSSLDGDYTNRGTDNGKPYYILVDTGDNPDANSISWQDAIALKGWTITNSSGDPEYTSFYEQYIVGLPTVLVPEQAGQVRIRKGPSGIDTTIQFDLTRTLSASTSDADSQDLTFGIGIFDSPTKTQIAAKIAELCVFELYPSFSATSSGEQVIFKERLFTQMGASFPENEGGWTLVSVALISEDVPDPSQVTTWWDTEGDVAATIAISLALGGVRPISSAWSVVSKPAESTVSEVDQVRIDGIVADGFPSSIIAVYDPTESASNAPNKIYTGGDGNPNQVIITVDLSGGNQILIDFTGSFSEADWTTPGTDLTAVPQSSSGWTPGDVGPVTFTGITFIPKAITQPLTSLGYAESVDVSIDTTTAGHGVLHQTLPWSEDDQVYENEVGTFVDPPDHVIRVRFDPDNDVTFNVFNVNTDGTSSVGDAGTSDGDGDQWDGSSFRISNLNSMPVATVTLDVPGSYTFRVTATDADGNTATDDVSVNFVGVFQFVVSEAAIGFGGSIGTAIQ